MSPQNIPVIRAEQANFSNGVMDMKIRTGVEKSGQILEKKWPNSGKKIFDHFFALQSTAKS